MLLCRYICNEQPLRSGPLDAHAFRTSDHAYALAWLHVLQETQHDGDAAAIVEAHARRLGLLCQLGGRGGRGLNQLDGAVGDAVEAAEIEFLRRIRRRQCRGARDGSRRRQSYPEQVSVVGYGVVVNGSPEVKLMMYR